MPAHETTDAAQPNRRAEVIEIFNIYIAYIRHENELIHQRAARFLGIQAALVAVVGLVLQKYLELAVSHKGELFTRPVAPIYLFISLLAGIALVSCKAAYKSLSAADGAQKYLDKRYRRLECGALKKYAKSIGLPDLRGGGNPELSSDGSRFILWVPIGFSIVWIIVFTINAFAAYYVFKS